MPKTNKSSAEKQLKESGKLDISSNVQPVIKRAQDTATSLLFKENELCII